MARARWLVSALCLGLGASAAAGAGAARADGPGDGLYGRFDGDLALTVGAGGGVRGRDGAARGTLVGELRLRIADGAGPFVSGEWSPEGPSQLVVGIELRPLFPSLFLLDRSTGYELLDLVLQSLGLELGAALTPLNRGVGVGFVVGGGIEIPFVLPSMWGDGVWLRLGARYLRATPRDQGGPEVAGSGYSVYGALLFKGLFGDAISEWEPARYRRVSESGD